MRYTHSAIQIWVKTAFLDVPTESVLDFCA